MKRIALFLLTNLAVLVTLSVVAHLFGLKHFIGAQGLDFGALLAFAALFGFGYYVTFIVLEIALGILASGISGGGKSAWTRFFSTHPPLEDRILALRGAATYRAASVPSQLN